MARKIKKTLYKNPEGYTLIEILVVISLLGLLASLVLPSLYALRARARDVKRIAEVENTIAALNLYYIENGHFPCHSFETSQGNPHFLQILTEKGYLQENLADPINLGFFKYEYRSHKIAPGTQCGMMVYFAYDSELLEPHCPVGVNVTSLLQPTRKHHCHVFLPGPKACSDPFENIVPLTDECNLSNPLDPSSENEY